MNLTEKISKYLTIGDAVKSDTAIRKKIDNSMDARQLVNARFIAVNVFDPIKDKFPEIGVYSFFRSKELNVAVNGSLNSFHSFAAALDLDSIGDKVNRDVFKFILGGGVPFNQLIWEYGDLNQPAWVHVGLLQGDIRHDIKRIYHDEHGIYTNKLLTADQATALFKL